MEADLIEPNPWKYPTEAAWHRAREEYERRVADKVPAWTAEDEKKLAERVRRAAEE